MAIALMFGVQAVDLRSHAMFGHYDARRHLSPLSLRIYETVREIVCLQPSENRAYIWNDHDQALDEHIVKIGNDIRNDGRLVQAINELSLS
jgi:phenylalanine ammonia-lyase